MKAPACIRPAASMVMVAVLASCSPATHAQQPEVPTGAVIVLQAGAGAVCEDEQGCIAMTAAAFQALVQRIQAMAMAQAEAAARLNPPAGCRRDDNNRT